MTTEELKKMEATLWQTADTLRANSDLKSTEYATPVLGIIFLRFADNKYSCYESEILSEYEKLKGTRRERKIEEIAIEKCGFYLPSKARYAFLLELPEKASFATAIKEAMQAIEAYKPELKDILPQDEYFRLENQQDSTLLKQLLKNFADIPRDASGDIFGQIYEYFLSKFALSEGQKGGEFFTPRSVVRLMVEIIEPHDGTVFDPACGSGGMFVQSAKFIEEHRKANAGEEAVNCTFVYGQEKTLETVKLAKMNLAVNGLRGDVKKANTYTEDPFDSFGKFDYVLANPPFNVDEVNLQSVERDRRFNTYGIPRNKGNAKKKDTATETVPNANYLWINLFATSLKQGGRAGLVMANSASDARHSEADIRKTLIENNLIYCMLTLPSNMFYTVTLPATLWFFDKGKADDRILFIDARNIFTQIDRAHREFTEEQIQDIAIISRLHRGDRAGFVELIHSRFTKGMEQLGNHKAHLAEVAEHIASFLKENGFENTPDFAPCIQEITELDEHYREYIAETNLEAVEAANEAQRQLSERFKPFFAGLHALLKTVDKEFRALTKDAKGKDLKSIKQELDELHREVKETEYFFKHIAWLQERFPKARYEDVTGLCKLATLADVKEQEYSLNPGRYVGIVIEEDGKTEGEFIEELLVMNAELMQLNAEARDLEAVIQHNILSIVEGA